MTTEIKSWLFDFQSAIEELTIFIPPEMDLEGYKNDIKTKRAVERNLEIIGEALNRIIKQNPDIAISHKRQIIGTRNRIIHGYDNVSDQLIWSIISQNLPQLKEEVMTLLES